MGSPANRQEAFAGALVDPARPAPGVLAAGGFGEPRGFAVYRNNRMVALVDALAATYPAIHRLVGEAFFRAAARVYIDREPPCSPVLHCYGARFGDFLEAFEPAGCVPFLGDLARLEWSYLCAYHGRDLPPISIRELASLPSGAAPDAGLTLHPSLGLHSSRWPIGSLWSDLLGAGEGPSVDMAQSEDVLVVRPSLAVRVSVLPDGAHPFISALGQHATIAEAARRASAASEGFELATQLQGLFALGAIVAVRTPQEEKS